MKSAFKVTVSVVFAAVLLAASAVAFAGQAQVEGNYQVLLVSDEGAREIGAVPCTRFVDETTLTVPDSTGPVTIRLVKQGGGKGHLDAVILDGRAPTSVQGGGEFTVKKLSARDNDIIEFPAEGMAMTFDEGGKSLAISARIENRVLSTAPVQFPLSRTPQGKAGEEIFYSYSLNANRAAMKIDGALDGLTNGAPLFKVFARPSSGHPDGFTYAWMSNDEENLYLAVDFTMDNTFDGEADYCALGVLTPSGLKEFKVAVGQEKWGRPGFTYTGKVSWQHKVYEFQVPLSELVLAAGTQEIKFAVKAYGTVAVPAGSYDPTLVFDKPTQNLLKLYLQWNSGLARYQPSYFLLGRDFSAGPAALSLADAAGLSGDADPQTGRFLAAWLDTASGDIRAQLINPDGALYDQNGNLTPEIDADSITIASGPGGAPFVAFDSNNKRFLAAWTDYSDNEIIKGAFIRPDGVMNGGVFKIYEPNPGASQFLAGLAFDNVNVRFLAVFYQRWNATSPYSISGQLVQYGKGPIRSDGKAGQQLTGISSFGEFGPGQPLSIDFDANNQLYCLAFSRDVAPDVDIYGQVLNKNGAAEGSAFPLSSAPGDQAAPTVAYSPRFGECLALWQDGRGADSAIYGQQFDDGGASGTDPERNFLVLEVPGEDQLNPDLKSIKLGQKSFYLFAREWENGVGTHYSDRAGEITLPPSEPSLISPKDGAAGVGKPAHLVFKKSHDPQGNSFNYFLTVCTDPNLAGCTAVKIKPGTLETVQNDNFRWGWIAGLSAFGMLLAGGVGRSKKGKALLIALALALGLTLGSCLYDGEPPEHDRTYYAVYTAKGLLPATTYYWKVVADNGEAFSETEIRSFTTK